MGIHLPVQGEDSAFCKATKPVHHNYGAHLETGRRSDQAHVLQLLGAAHLVHSAPHKRSSRSEKPMLHNEE